MDDSTQTIQPHTGSHAPDEQGSMIPRFYMSGDLRAATGLSRTQLDYYLREGVVQPTARTESGYLLFDEHERDIVDRIIGWREEGIGLREIRQRLHREEKG